MEAVYCLGQQKGETEHYASQVLTLLLAVTLVWQCWLSAQLSKIQKTRILSAHTSELFNQSNRHKISTDQPFVILVVNSRQQMIHAIVSFFHL